MKLTSAALTTALLLSTTAPALAQHAPHHAPPPPPGHVVEVRAHRNPAMMVAGMVLTGVASAALVAGLITIPVFSRQGGDFSGIGVAIVSLPMIGGSIIFAGVGIPLWVVGAKAPPAHHAALIPSLSAGAGSGTLRWSF